jgi:hypothetical protein
MEQKQKFHAKGNILVFGKWVGQFETSTLAASKQEAKRNVEYQYKTQNNMLPTAKVQFVGDITEV